jgi:hypothetical protein
VTGNPEVMPSQHNLGLSIDETGSGLADNFFQLAKIEIEKGTARLVIQSGRFLFSL